MSNCAFCEHGVHPFYELDAQNGGKKTICHTCFHTGKHHLVVAHPAVQAPAVKSPTVPEKASTSKRQ